MLFCDYAAKFAIVLNTAAPPIPPVVQTQPGDADALAVNFQT
jgi:hypothetical protein